MLPEQFITAYSAALATQQWKNVEPLIYADACVTFSNGSVHKGIAAIKAAYERNFSLIKSEEYTISNVHWVKHTDELTIYLFDFNWTGIINGARASGGGRGTAVLVNDKGVWKLLAEHLGPSK